MEKTNFCYVHTCTRFLCGSFPLTDNGYINVLVLERERGGGGGGGGGRNSFCLGVVDCALDLHSRHLEFNSRLQLLFSF